jgi:alcohol dehydrogenase, propanol-preferring
MRAAVLSQFNQPLQIVDVETPLPGVDDLIIKVSACGVCHSDLHIVEGDFKAAKLPLVPGHEVVGTVVACGDGVSDFAIGDRVGVAWQHSSCGVCEQCREGRENLCAKQSVTGLTVNGGYAQFMRAKANHAIRIPDSLSSIDAAPLFCAGVTVYRGLKQAGIEPGQRVAIFGVGGLGHLAVQIACAFGAQVLAVDIAEDKLQLARSLGADHTFNATAPESMKQIRALGGAHVAIVTSAAKPAYDAALRALRPAGTLVVVGLPSEPLTFQALALVSSEARIMGSAVGTRQDIREVLALAAAGKVHCHSEVQPLERVNDVLDRMRAATISGRVVLEFA